MDLEGTKYPHSLTPMVFLIFGSLVAACSITGPTANELILPRYTTIEAIHQTGQISADHKYLLVKDLPESTNLVVLVHGWMGDQSTTWGHLPEILSGGSGDSGPLEWTKRFNVFLYGYPTLGNERELTRQARIFLTEIQLARQKCRCKHVYLVGHSMGGLLITRSLVTLLSKDTPDPDEQSLLEALTAIVLIAPAFQLLPEVLMLGGYIPNKQIAEMGDFSEFRRDLEDDLERLRREHPDRYAKVFSQRTAFILAEDDTIVDNEGVRSLFPDSKQFSLPGTHVGVVKVDTPTNETFLALGEILKRMTPIQLVQFPRKRELRLDLDKVRISPRDEVYLEDDSLATRVIVTARKATAKIEASITPRGYGFYTVVFDEPSFHSNKEWIIRIIREPTSVATQKSHILSIFVDGRLFGNLPIITRQTNLAVYEETVRKFQPILEGNPPYRRVRSWGEGKTTDDLVRTLLKPGLMEQTTSANFLTQAFLEYVAGDTVLLPLELISTRTKEQSDPMVLKWQGIAALLHRNPGAALEKFQKFSPMSSVGEAYTALTLGLMGQPEQAKAVLESAPQSLYLTEGFREDAERIFGKNIIDLLLPKQPPR